MSKCWRCPIEGGCGPNDVCVLYAEGHSDGWYKPPWADGPRRIPDGQRVARGGQYFPKYGEVDRSR
jgi:hypothetical protein